MGRLRINIAGLMGLILLAAVGLAALRNLPGKWANLVFSLALGLNFIAVVVAIGMSGRGRIIALGYAICGWGYLVLVSVFPSLDSFVRNNLITARVVEWFFQGPQPVLSSYVIVAHSLFGIAAGLAGVLVAWSFVMRSGLSTSRGTVIP